MKWLAGQDACVNFERVQRISLYRDYRDGRDAIVAGVGLVETVVLWLFEPGQDSESLFTRLLQSTEGWCGQPRTPMLWLDRVFYDRPREVAEEGGGSRQ